MAVIIEPTNSPETTKIKFLIMKVRRMLDLKDHNMWWKDDEVEFVNEFDFKSETLTREKLMYLIRRIRNEERK